MRPIPIVREDKVLGQASDKPVEQKYTYQNANEDRDKINEAINYLPIFIISDDNGLIKGYEVSIEGSPINILLNKSIGGILQLGSMISYAEYNPILQEGGDMFSKDLDETIIMQSASHDPMEFLPNTAYLLFPR